MLSTNELVDWDREDILAEVRKKKKSLAALCREHGYSESTLSNALTRPWPRGEKIIADAIGVSPEEIWPSRYRKERHKRGRRPQKPGMNGLAKNSDIP